MLLRGTDGVSILRDGHFPPLHEKGPMTIGQILSAPTGTCETMESRDTSHVEVLTSITRLLEES